MEIYNKFGLCIGVLHLMVTLIVAQSQQDHDENVQEQERETLETTDETADDPTHKDVDYAVGSICGYCKYCQFCKLCDNECPCEKSGSKPNCHMCKYCTYCYLCTGICDTVCQPGGVLDKVSSAIVNSLPSFNSNDVEADLKTVEEWTKGRDEL